MKPPFEITNEILNLVTNITEKANRITSYNYLNKRPELRRNKRIRSIHSSLAIEANSLSLNEVKDIIDGKKVIGDRKEIQEVKNAYKAYEMLPDFNPFSITDLKKAHSIMTSRILNDNGKFRNHDEGIYDGEQVIFVCPPPDFVPNLMNDLFNWLKENKNTIHPLIYSCIFHYEFVFIHPFSDGNGRCARLWQTAFLSKWKDIFLYVPIENLIKNYQNEYYEAISACHVDGTSTKFISFMLRMIDKSLEEILECDINENFEDLSDKEIEILNYIRNNKEASSSEIAMYINMSTRSAIRLLNSLLEKDKIVRTTNKLNDKTAKYKLK